MSPDDAIADVDDVANKHRTFETITGTETETGAKWPHWGTRSYTVMPHVSPASKRVGESFRPRPTDVVVISFPKTGTTWTQNVVEQLRTAAGGYGFADITERQPWLEFAWDLGQDPDAAQAARPRVFKSHQLLSAVNPGGRYLCIVRDPEATLLSWFAFQQAKGRPGYAEYDDADDYVAHRGPDLFASDAIFGTNIWDMYAEMWSARNDPAVKILVYEALLADGPAYTHHLPAIAKFLGLPDPDEALCAKVAHLVSRDQMLQHLDRFDDHFITERGRELGRALRVMEPAPKVRSGEDRSAGLSKRSVGWLEDRWAEKMTPRTGHKNYDEFAAAIADLAATDGEELTAGLDGERTSAVRRSSITVDDMPFLRRRRGSLAPHE